MVCSMLARSESLASGSRSFISCERNSSSMVRFSMSRCPEASGAEMVWLWAKAENRPDFSTCTLILEAARSRSAAYAGVRLIASISTAKNVDLVMRSFLFPSFQRGSRLIKEYRVGARHGCQGMVMTCGGLRARSPLKKRVRQASSIRQRIEEIPTTFPGSGEEIDIRDRAEATQIERIESFYA